MSRLILLSSHTPPIRNSLIIIKGIACDTGITINTVFINLFTSVYNNGLIINYNMLIVPIFWHTPFLLHRESETSFTFPALIDHQCSISSLTIFNNTEMMSPIILTILLIRHISIEKRILSLASASLTTRSRVGQFRDESVFQLIAVFNFLFIGFISAVNMLLGVYVVLIKMDKNTVIRQTLFALVKSWLGLTSEICCWNGFV